MRPLSSIDAPGESRRFGGSISPVSELMRTFHAATSSAGSTNGIEPS